MNRIGSFLRDIFCLKNPTQVEFITDEKNRSIDSVIIEMNETIKSPQLHLPIDFDKGSVRVRESMYQFVQLPDNLPRVKDFRKIDYFDFDFIPEYEAYEHNRDVTLQTSNITKHILDSNNSDSEYHCVEFGPTVSILPPQISKKPTLVLDLDHTLVYPSMKEQMEYDFSITLDSIKDYTIYFVKRPGLEEFLLTMRQYYEMIVFTAGIMPYGIKVTKKIDKHETIDYLLSRKYCRALTRTGERKDAFTKDLSILGRDINQVLIVDDREYSYMLNDENGQYIPPFYGDKNDTALFELQKYLVDLSGSKDFRNRTPFVFKKNTLHCG